MNTVYEHDGPLSPPPRAMLMLEGRVLLELGALALARPILRTAPHGDGHPVMVLPGLAASDVSTSPLRSYLRELGYKVYGWGAGRNLGRRGVLDDLVLPRLLSLRQLHGRRVSLIGWSLGGILARELAKRAPDAVRLVITLGSPFADPGATNVSRFFEVASGRRMGTDPATRRRLREPPPVPTTSVFTRSDGVVAWRACVQEHGPGRESIEVRASHIGLAYSPAVLWAIADRLALPEGRWRAFDPGPLAGVVYPRRGGAR
jgi:pimeloyl-ACP methyl ester carboxylesterase